MEKKKKDLYVNFGPVKIYKEQIKLIVDKLAELDETWIAVNDYVLSSFEEIDDFKDVKINELFIHSQYKESLDHLYLKVIKNQCTLLATTDSTFMQGIFAYIEKIISERKRKCRWIESLFYFVAPFGTTISLLIIQLKVYESETLEYIGYSLFGVMVLIIVLYLSTIGMRKSEVIISKEQKNNFWKRNKDTIIVAVITSILSILFTLFTQWLLK